MNFIEITNDMCHCYLEDSKSLISEKLYNQVFGWYRARDIKRLATCTTLMSTYDDVSSVRFLRQIAAFYKKNPVFAESQQCLASAKLAFTKGEELCEQTNARLDSFMQNRFLMEPELQKLSEKAQCIIADVLGELKVFLQSEMVASLRVTAGATSTLSRRKSLPPLKLTIKGMAATPAAQPYLRYIGAQFGYPRMKFDTVYSNRVETVPKNWKTDRTIACEPTGNLFLQLTFDRFVKRQLLKLDVDLSSQCRNQWMAHEGSISDDFVTIDLSMASDTVALNTVWQLFPYEWAQMLVDFRSPLGEGFDECVEYAKFSSMGNGCTFGIETLIFAAFCKATGAKHFAVYGDDLVIHRRHYVALARLLEYFGFSINQEKSYIQGPFRESCGSDWYNGESVTPTYLQFEHQLRVELVHCVNSVACIAIPDGKLEGYLCAMVHKENLPLVPFSENSMHGVWVDTHTAYRAKILRTKHSITTYKAFVPHTSDRIFRDSRALFLWHLDATRASEGSLSSGTSSIEYFRKFGEIDETIDYLLVKGINGRQVIVRSRASVYTCKYIRKWVHWIPPVVATPAHLYRWSELITRVSQ